MSSSSDGQWTSLVGHQCLSLITPILQLRHNAATIHGSYALSFNWVVWSSMFMFENMTSSKVKILRYNHHCLLFSYLIQTIGKSGPTLSDITSQLKIKRHNFLKPIIHQLYRRRAHDNFLPGIGTKF